MTDLLDNLQPEMMADLIQTLAKDPAVRKKMLDIVVTKLQEMDLEDIHEDVFDVLDGIDVHDLWHNAGATADGYCSAEDMAAQMIEEALDPFITALQHYYEAQRPEDAFQYCKGILKGLYRYEHESESEFLEWSQDIAKDWFDNLFDTWHTTKPSNDFVVSMAAFIQQNCPNWG